MKTFLNSLNIFFYFVDHKLLMTIDNLNKRIELNIKNEFSKTK
jgi:hypothetical protein